MSTNRYRSKEYLLERSLSVKRLFDISVSLILLAISFPLCFLIALLIKTTSKGSLFYLSPRLGEKGRPFLCWKFRTMQPQAKEKLQQLLDENPELQKEWNTYFKLKNDPRVTLIGKWLRKTSLDELPQLWNVLKGDLSLVGPRPYLEEELKKIQPVCGKKILSIKPGITGLWQVSGRNHLPFLDRIRLDEEYLNKRSLAFDVLLLCKTIPVVLFAKGH